MQRQQRPTLSPLRTARPRRMAARQFRSKAMAARPGLFVFLNDVWLKVVETGTILFLRSLDKEEENDFFLVVLVTALLRPTMAQWLHITERLRSPAWPLRRELPVCCLLLRRCSTRAT